MTDQRVTTRQLRSSLARSLRQQAALLSLSTLERQAFEARIQPESCAWTRGRSRWQRVSFWSFREDPAAIHCDALYLRDADRLEAGVTLAEADYPRYFEALRRGETVSAADAPTRTRGRASSRRATCGPLGIGAMLDVPVYVRGRLQGVVCHEHVGGPRTWTDDEQLFAMSIGQLVSLAIETRDREAAEEALRESEARFRHMALHDPLTGLPNRAYFVDRLRGEVARGGREPELHRFAVLFIDLDGFSGQEINDTLGHDVGDAVLVEAATRMRGCLRATDTADAGRWRRVHRPPGPPGGTPASWRTSRSGSPRRCARPSWSAGRSSPPPASVGRTLGDGTVADASAVLRRADEAMYRVKQQRGGRV